MAATAWAQLASRVAVNSRASAVITAQQHFALTATWLKTERQHRKVSTAATANECLYMQNTIQQQMRSFSSISRAHAIQQPLRQQKSIGDRGNATVHASSKRTATVFDVRVASAAAVTSTASSSSSSSSPFAFEDAASAASDVAEHTDFIWQMDNTAAEASAAMVTIATELARTESERFTLTTLLCTPIENGLLLIHDGLGLPWWLTIAAVTLAARILFLPIMVAQVKTAASMVIATPEIQALTAKLNADQKSPNGISNSRRAANQVAMNAVYKRHDVKMYKLIGTPLLMMPTFIIFFLSLQHMALRYHDSMATGGFRFLSSAFDVTDLTVAGPLYFLPLLSGLTSVASIYLSGRDATPSSTAENTRYVFMSLAMFGSLFTGTYLPSAVFIYWNANNILTMLQQALLRDPAVKRLLGVKIAPKAGQEVIQPHFNTVIHSTAHAAAATATTTATSPSKPLVLYSSKVQKSGKSKQQQNKAFSTFRIKKHNVISQQQLQ